MCSRTRSGRCNCCRWCCTSPRCRHLSWWRLSSCQHEAPCPTSECSFLLATPRGPKTAAGRGLTGHGGSLATLTHQWCHWCDAAVCFYRAFFSWMWYYFMFKTLYNKVHKREWIRNDFIVDSDFRTVLSLSLVTLFHRDTKNSNQWFTNKSSLVDSYLWTTHEESGVLKS